MVMRQMDLIEPELPLDGGSFQAPRRPRIVAYIVSDGRGDYIERHATRRQAERSAREMHTDDNSHAVGVEFDDGSVTFEW